MTMATWATNEIKMSAGAARRWREYLDLSHAEMVSCYIKEYGLRQFVFWLCQIPEIEGEEIVSAIRPHAEAYKKEHGRYPEYLEWLGFVNPSVPLKIITPHSPQMRLF